MDFHQRSKLGNPRVAVTREDGEEYYKRRATNNVLDPIVRTTVSDRKSLYVSPRSDDLDTSRSVANKEISQRISKSNEPKSPPPFSPCVVRQMDLLSQRLSVMKPAERHLE